jgi:hypothetical protein
LKEIRRVRMIFTEQHKEAAKAFETLAGAVLAEYFVDKLHEDDAMNNAEDLKNCDNISEALKFVKDFTERAEAHERNIKLLKDIQEGKYRLLFTALAAGMEKARDVLNENVDKETLKNIIEEEFNLGED